MPISLELKKKCSFILKFYLDFHFNFFLFFSEIAGSLLGFLSLCLHCNPGIYLQEGPPTAYVMMYFILFPLSQ